jgi:hypothetical protein
VASFPQGSGDSFISEFFQFEGKLYTPLQLDVPTKPRLFLSGGVQIPLADKLIAERVDQEQIERYEPGVGSQRPAPIGLPDDSAFVRPEFSANCPDTGPGSNPVTNPFNRIESCALRIRNMVTVDAMWFIGAGVEFSLPAFDSYLRFRPSLEYYGMSIQNEGTFVRTSGGVAIDDLEEYASTVGDAEIYHGLSTALAMSVDVFETGSWRWSMYVQGRAIFFLNEPTLSAQTALSNSNVFFSSTVDDLALQAGGGVQIQWVGPRK